ncbi:MAG: PD-(D/E)XK nuclease family transposase [Prevotella sp.]|nr:PD-(D/E)XK nuclease family transposase [Prevotella sp.]
MEEDKKTLTDGLLSPQERYINPYTDFGFKKLFGTEMNKDLLISFLNALFSGTKKEIKDVQYLNSEHLGDGYGDRRAVFDVYCMTEDGGRFIVEMQKAEQAYFKDRSIYYSTFAIREQAPKGQEWDYHLEDVYTVGVLNFKFPANEYPADKYRHEVKLKDIEDNHVFYDKLTFVYLEMPKFNKAEAELKTMFDKWMFVLRNLSRLLERPKALQDRIFQKLFDQAEIARYTPEERREYEASIKNYWDYYSTMKTAVEKSRAEGREEGRAEGREEERRENARRMKKDNMPTELIAKYTGLSVEDIERL